MSEFRHKTVRGISWSVVGQAGNQALIMVTVIVLARLLSPREFGLLAMVVVVTSFAGIFAEMGLSAAIIQKRDVRQEHLSSVFWLNLAAGLLLALIFVAGSPLIARFYGEPILAPLTVLVSANFVIGSVSIVQRTTFVKALDFRRLFVVDIVAVAVSGVVAVAMAFAGAGVWSLAAQSVVVSVMTAALLWSLSRWRPSFVFRWSAIRDLLGFSANLFGTELLNYWVRNLDYLLIGRFIGTQPLGVYKNAYQVMLFPLTNVSRVISKVMFPALSMIQNEKTRVRKVFLQLTGTVALVTFPIMTGLFATVKPFTLTVFGPKWAGMIPILQVFCLTGMMQSIGTLNGNLYLSQGRADLQFRVSLFVKASAVLGIVIGLRWGVLGVAVGYAAASLLNSYPAFYYAGRLVNLTYWQLWRSLSGVLGCSAVMALVVAGLGVVLPATCPRWLCLLVQVLVGASVYGALVHLLQIAAYREARQVVAEQYRMLRLRQPHSDDESLPDPAGAGVSG